MVEIERFEKTPRFAILTDGHRLLSAGVSLGALENSGNKRLGERRHPLPLRGRDGEARVVVSGQVAESSRRLSGAAR